MADPIPSQSTGLSGPGSQPASTQWWLYLKGLGDQLAGVVAAEPAPDVAGFTATVATNIDVAGSPYYQFSGTVTLGADPAGDASIDVVMTDASGNAGIVYSFPQPFTGGDVLHWQSQYFPQPTSGPDLVFQPTVVPLNAANVPTVSLQTVGTLTVTVTPPPPTPEFDVDQSALDPTVVNVTNLRFLVGGVPVDPNPYAIASATFGFFYTQDSDFDYQLAGGAGGPATDLVSTDATMDLVTPGGGDPPVAHLVAVPWVNGVDYAVGSVVVYAANGLTYLCILSPSAGFLPTNTTYWSPAAAAVPGTGYALIGGELVKCTANTGDVVSITRAQLGSVAATVLAASMPVSVSPLDLVSVTIPFPAGFFSSPDAATWVLSQPLPNTLLVAVVCFLTSLDGNSPLGIECLTATPDHGLVLTAPAPGALVVTSYDPADNTDFTIVTGNVLYNVRCTTRACTATLPPEVSDEGNTVTVRLTTDSTFDCLIQPGSSGGVTDKIDGATTPYTVTAANPAWTGVGNTPPNDGNWTTTSTIGSGSTSSVPDAPNIVSVTPLSGSSLVVYGLNGNVSAWQIACLINLPTVDTDYIAGHLKKIHVLWSQSSAWANSVTYAKGEEVTYSGVTYVSLSAGNYNHQPNTSPTFWQSGGAQPQELRVIYGPWASSPITYVSEWIDQDNVAVNGVLGFFTENDIGIVTRGNDLESNPPLTVALTIEASVVASLTAGDAATLTIGAAWASGTAYVPGNTALYASVNYFALIANTGITPATLAAVGVWAAAPHYADENGSTHAVVWFAPVLGSSQVPQVVAVFADYGDGLGWVWNSNPTMTQVGQWFTLQGDVWLPTATSQTMRLALLAGWWNGDATPLGNNLPEGAVIQSGPSSFTLSAVAAPTATEITGIHFLNAPGTTSPIQYVQQQDGSWKWNFYELDFTLPVNDHFWNWQLWKVIGHLSGSTFVPATDWTGALVEVEEDTGEPGELIQVAGLGGDGWGLPVQTNADGSANVNWTYLFVIKAASRLNNGTGTGVAVQTGWSGATATYVLSGVTITGGYLTPAPQPPGLDLSRAIPAPDIAGFTALVTLNIQVSGLPYFQFYGTVTMSAAPGSTAEVEVIVTDGAGVPAVAYKLRAPFTGGAVLTWTSLLFVQPTSGPALSYIPSVKILNGAGTPNAYSHTLAAISIPNGTSTLAPGALPESPYHVTVSETGPRQLNVADQTTTTTLTVVVMEPIVPSGAFVLGTNLHVQLSSDGGTSWFDAGPGLFAASHNPATDEDGTHTWFVSNLAVVKIPVWGFAQSIWARAWALNAYVDGGPASATASTAAYTLAAVSPPLATGAAIAIQTVAGVAPTTANSIYMGLNGLNNPYAQVNLIVTPPGNGDPNCEYYWGWVEWSDNLGNPIDPGGVLNTRGWNPGEQFVNNGVAKQWNLQINFPKVGLDGWLRMEFWGFNRAATASKPGILTNWAGDANVVLQTGWTGVSVLSGANSGLLTSSSSGIYLLHVGAAPNASGVGGIFSGSACQVGIPYHGSVVGTGGSGIYTYAITAGTPPSWLTFVNGAFSGTPFGFGTFQLTVTVTDSNGVSGVCVVDITISPATSPPPVAGMITACAAGIFSGSRQIATDQETTVLVAVTPTWAANYGQESLTVWMYYRRKIGDAPAWFWVQTLHMLASGTSGRFFLTTLVVPTTASGAGASPVTGASGAMVAVLPGPYTGDSTVALGSSALGPTISGVSGFQVSAPFDLALVPPSATAATLTLTNSAGSPPSYGSGGAGSNIYMGINSIGDPYCMVNVAVATPLNGDPDCWYYDAWVQWTDNSGNPLSPGGVGNQPGWQPGPQFVNDGTTQWWMSGAAGQGFFINFPATGIDGYLTIEFWAHNRSMTGNKAPFAGDGNSVPVQWPSSMPTVNYSTGASGRGPGGTSYVLHVGPPPGNTLDLKQTNPNSLQNNLAQNASGQVGVNSSNLSNILLNGGFENGALGSSGAGWVKNLGSEVGLEATSGFAYTGTQYYRTDVGLVNGGVHQSGISCRPGDVFYIEAYINAILSITGQVYIYAGWLNAAGGGVPPYYSPSTPLTIYGGMGWQKISGTFTAPTQASSLIVYIQTPSTSGSGAWYIDNVFMNRPTTVTTSGVVTLDTSGAVTLAAGAITAASNVLGALAVVDSNISTVGMNKVTYGISIFAGDVILARGYNLPAVSLTNGGIYLYSAATTTGANPSGYAAGLTTSPYVSIQGTGIGLFQGGPSPYPATYFPNVTMNSGGITLTNPGTFWISGAFYGAGQVVLYPPNGLTYICLVATSSVAPGNPSYWQQVSAASLQIEPFGFYIVGPSGSVTLNANGITIQNGTSSVAITAASVAINNGTFYCGKRRRNGRYRHDLSLVHGRSTELAIGIQVFMVLVYIAGITLMRSFALAFPSLYRKQR